MKRGYPSLFAPDSDEEFSSDSESGKEEQARPSLLPLEVSLVEILQPNTDSTVEVQPRLSEPLWPTPEI